jgi:putative transposase
VIRFIDEHKDGRSGNLRWGIEPIAKTLGIAPQTYHAAKARPPSARAVRDGELKPVILKMWEDNLSVYGADKIWDQLNKDGVRVARCTVERLMGQLGIQGCVRGRSLVRTTQADDSQQRPADLVERRFCASAPNRLWLADLTYVKTHAGWVYVAFIIDAFSRMVVGWQASRSLRADLAIDALEMAISNRKRPGADLAELIHHSDRGSQYLSIRYSQRLADNGIVASVGSKGDSYDKTLVSYCTSLGVFVTSSVGESASHAFDESGVCGVGQLIEAFVLVVGLVGSEQAGPVPGFDGGGADAETVGGLGEGEHSLGSEPFGVAGELVGAA